MWLLVKTSLKPVRVEKQYERTCEFAAASVTLFVDVYFSQIFGVQSVLGLRQRHQQVASVTSTSHRRRRLICKHSQTKGDTN